MGIDMDQKRHMLWHTNAQVRYSAAYPTGRELLPEPRDDAPKKLCFGGEPRLWQARRASKGPRESVF